MTPNQNMMWDGQGPVMIGRFDPVNGTPAMGYLVDVYRIGCGTSALTTSLSVEKKIIKESCSGQRLALKERETAKQLEVKLDMIQFSGRTLGIALYGDAVVTNSGTVTDEALPTLKAGDYFVTRHPDVSSLVIEDSTALTPLVYVAGTHYEVEDAKHGRCRLIAHPAGHVEPLKMDYSYGEYTNIPAFTKSGVERGILFSGINGDGQRARILIPRISLAPNGDFSWIAEEEATLSLSGQALYVDQLATDADFGPFMRVDLI